MDMKKKICQFFLAFLGLSLVFNGTTRAFENAWAIYKNIDLSPDENKVIFERCNFFEGEGCDDSVKGNEIYVVDITGKNLESVTRPSPSFQNLSPDKSLVLCPMHGGWYLVDIKTGSIVKQIAEDCEIKQFSWSPTGKKFLLTTRSNSTGKAKASLVDAVTFEETVLDSDFVTVELPFQWYSDGSTFLYLMPLPYPEIYFWDVVAMRSDLLASGDPGEQFGFFNISPDDQKMLYKYQDYYKIQYLHRLSNRIPGRPRRKIVCREVDLPAWSYEELNKQLWSQTDEDVLKRMDYVMLQRDFGRPFYFAKIQVIWSPDGQKVLIKGKDQIWIYDLAEDKFTPLWRDTSSVITDVVFDPNQPRIFLLIFGWEDLDGSKDFNRSTEGYNNLCMLDLSGGSLKTIVERTSLDNHLVFSSDGKLLAFEKNRNIWLLNLENLVAHQLTPSSGRNTQWLKDDKRILFKNAERLYGHGKYGSLYTIDISGKNLMRLTMDKAMQPVWLNNGEIAVKSEGKYWRVNIDKLGVVEMSDPPKRAPRTKGNKYEVYINEFTSGFSPIKVTEIWAKEIATSKSWEIVEAIKNW
jgi:Tol biopolymer transport system component